MILTKSWPKDDPKYVACEPKQDVCKIAASLITGDKEGGYKLKKKGEVWYDILSKHSDLVGVLTRELSGSRRKNV